MGFFGSEIEAVVVEADFAECDGVAGGVGRDSEGAEGVEVGGWSGGVGGELMGGTGVDADGGVAEAG